MPTQALTTESVQAFLKKNLDRHLSNKVLHAHPSPAYWSTEVDPDALRACLTPRKEVPEKINLYLGIPYCLPTDPPHCGFCLFPTVAYEGKQGMEAYLHLLEKEAGLYREVYGGAVLESVYVGGGTPNLLQAQDYHRLMAIVQGLFPALPPGIEKSIEGIPQLFNKEKIAAIRSAGFNRVSMGVQQMNETLIRYSGRRQTNRQVFEAIDEFHRQGLACNVDLIFGWPEQSIEDMLDGLRAIVASGVRHITHYELNIAGRSDFATRNRPRVPSMRDKLRMYHEAGAYLRSEGFVQDTVYDWSRPVRQVAPTGIDAAQYLYEDQLRSLIHEDFARYMGGLGFGAINTRLNAVRSGSLMNHRGLGRYAEAVNAGRFPVERAFFHEAEDIRLSWIFQQLQGLQLDPRRFEALFGRSLYFDHAAVLNELTRLGWLQILPGGVLRLVGDGGFYTPLIQSLFSHARLGQMAQPRQTIALAAG
ncbi:MAG: radical SAM protein [Curvibacter sp.]|nr:radical SAM protein [Curvibacter sp.]